MHTDIEVLFNFLNIEIDPHLLLVLVLLPLLPNDRVLLPTNPNFVLGVEG